MKFIDKVLETSEIEADIKEDVLAYYEEAKKEFKKMNIPMDEDAELVFSNHLIALLKRIKRKAFVADIDEEMFSEVSEKAYNLAETLVKPFFEKEGETVNRTEVFLVATHIELALQKEEMKHE